MMWSRTIMQVQAQPASAFTFLTVFAVTVGVACSANLVIEVPGCPSVAEGAQYQLDYRPPLGEPAPNFTVLAQTFTTINFQGLPGTMYHFMLYYSNATFSNLLVWSQTINTAPDPPSNLTVTLDQDKQATISWSQPAYGNYTGFRFKVLPMIGVSEEAREISVEGNGNWSLLLHKLTPGATYQLHAFTLLQDKESTNYASYNFTTKPNIPRLSMWFRNDTSLLLVWQPPNPPCVYARYKVTIEPQDVRDTVLYVEKENEMSGPAQVKFNGLVPGRVYNISVQTVSDSQLSAPAIEHCRTVPPCPRNVSVEYSETAFRVSWLPPDQPGEFQSYQLSVKEDGAAQRLPPLLRARGEPLTCAFDGLKPGAHYRLTVKTMAGKVTSWPASADVTLRPLPVQELRAESTGDALVLTWVSAEGSMQDAYRVTYHEANDASNVSVVSTVTTDLTLNTLLPGRNYSVSVAAVSRGVASNNTSVWGAIYPTIPVLYNTTDEATVTTNGSIALRTVSGNIPTCISNKLFILNFGTSLEKKLLKKKLFSFCVQ